ncbi:FAR1 DNA binding domain [Macleaya cordata]|uniref:FAR1 DNA binding domain n=1 Tax=Macleaya cordata TaxID=56857 RepID=A0A200R9H3_MACCD|nr:FAR1 DNA binding domain [Macleaya cordata]
MASTSRQELELNRCDRGWEAETSNDHEASHSSENHEVLQCSIELAVPSVETLEPYLGMEFTSLEAARGFYEIYGTYMGFTIRNAHIRRSQKDNSIIGREFVCSKEGFRAKKLRNMEKKNLPPRPATREGCNARLRVKKDGGKWIVTGFVKEHSHELNASKIPRPDRLQMNASNDEDEKDKRIRELFQELQHEKKLHAACKRQLNMVVKYVEEHNQNLSLKVEVIVNNVKELESEVQDVPPHR